MRYGVLAVFVLTVLLTVAGCGPSLSARNARSQIASLGGSELVPDDIEIERIVTQTTDRMIAETTLQLAFQFERGPDEQWQIVAVRLGDRQWVDMATLLQALESQRRESTAQALEQLRDGVDAFRNENAGALPEISPEDYVSDVLHPRFMAELVRTDGWGGAIRYETESGGYQLRSAGPDGLMGNADDVVVSARSD